jgi:putative tributyrin esterase
MPNPLRRLKRAIRKRGSPRHLVERAVESKALGRGVRFATLSPPLAETRPDLPVFLLLHGLGDDHLALDDFGVSARLLDAIAAGRLPPFHVVAPDGGRGFWIDWHDGSRRCEACVLEDVLPEAERLLGTDPSRERRHVLGVSMGGIGALHVGLRHPELFASAGALSGAILDEAQAVRFSRESYFRWLVPLDRIFGDGADRAFLEAHNPFAVTRRRGAPLGQRLFLAAGADETPFFTATTRAFHAHLERLGAAHAYEEYAGGHGWRFWTPVLERAIRYALGSD